MMKKKVNLKTIIDALDCVSDETSVYYDVQSGEIIMWNDDWDNEDLDPDELEEVLDEGKYISLPDRFEIKSPIALRRPQDRHLRVYVNDAGDNG